MDDSEPAPRGRGRGRRGPLSTAAWVSAVLVSWFAMTLIYAETQRDRQTVFSSDLVLPFMVARDLIRDPRTVGDWYFSPSNYAFPDVPLAAMLLVSPLPKMVMPIAYGGLLLTAYGLLAGWLLVTMRTARWSVAALWGTTLIGLLMIAGNATPYGFGGSFLNFICAAAIHSGAVVCGLVLIPLLSQVFNGSDRDRRRATVAAATLVALCCYSDRAFALWFAGPACFAYLVSRTRMRLPRKLPTIAGLAAVGIAAVALDHLRPTSRTGYKFDFDARKSLAVVVESVRTAIAEGQWQLWLPVALLLPMCLRAVWLLATPRARRHATRDAAELAVILCGTAALACPIALNALHHPSLLRYSLPIFVLPYIWLLAFAFRWSVPGLRPWLYVTPLVLWAWVATLAPRGFAALDVAMHGESLARTLAELGQTAGYGDYWTAKRTMYETDYAIHCVQVDRLLRVKPYIYRQAWFHRRADDGGEIRPTFVVLSKLDESLVRRAFGEPAEVRRFRNETIWLYEEPLPLLGRRGFEPAE